MNVAFYRIELAVGGPLHLNERQYGFLLTCLGAGGVIGTVVVGPMNRLLGRRWSMFVDIIGSFALVAVPAVVPARPRSAVAVGAGRHGRVGQRGEGVGDHMTTTTKPGGGCRRPSARNRAWPLHHRTHEGLSRRLPRR